MILALLSWITISITQFPVFILLIAPDNTPVTSRDAEVVMLELLKEADVIHGVCVYRPQVAFYEVAKHVEQMCREPVPDLELPTFGPYSFAL
jgi:hypothetical protein